MILSAFLIGSVLLLGGLVQGTEMCGWYQDFRNHVSPGSPLISDYQQLLNDIQYTDDEWQVDGLGHLTLKTNGTCGVGVEAAKRGDAIFYIGNVDIKHIVEQSIRDYGTNGLVSTDARMWCKRTVSHIIIPDQKDYTFAVFGIYHT